MISIVELLAGSSCMRLMKGLNFTEEPGISTLNVTKFGLNSNEVNTCRKKIPNGAELSVTQIVEALTFGVGVADTIPEGVKIYIDAIYAPALRKKLVEYGL